MDLLWHIVNHIQLIHIASMTRRKEILFISVNSTLHKGTMPTVQGFTVRQFYTAPLYHCHIHAVAAPKGKLDVQKLYLYGRLLKDIWLCLSCDDHQLWLISVAWFTSKICKLFVNFTSNGRFLRIVVVQKSGILSTMNGKDYEGWEDYSFCDYLDRFPYYIYYIPNKYVLYSNELFQSSFSNMQKINNDQTLICFICSSSSIRRSRSFPISVFCFS